VEIGLDNLATLLQAVAHVLGLTGDEVEEAVGQVEALADNNSISLVSLLKSN
jgi:hypothetical protein